MKTKTWTRECLCKVLFATILSISLFSFGYNISILNISIGLFSKLEKKSYSNEKLTFPFSEANTIARKAILSTLVASLYLGAIFGSSIVNKVDKLVASIWKDTSCSSNLIMEQSLLSTMVFFIPGLAIYSSASSYWLMLCGRIWIGIGVGMTCVQVQLFLRKISNNSLVSGIGSIGVVLGMLIVELMGAQGVQWRTTARIDLGLQIVQLIMLLIIGYNRDMNEWVIKEEEFPKTKVYVHNPKISRNLSLAIFLHISQQMSGIIGILSFSDIIFKNKNSNVSPGLIIASVNLLGTLISFFLVDRIGRRTLILVSTMGMSISAVVLVLGEINHISELKIVCLLMFVLTYSIGLGPLPWLIMTELFPVNLKQRYSSIAVLANWVSTLTMALIFLPLASILKEQGMFILLALLNGLLFLILWMVMIETRKTESNANVYHANDLNQGEI